MFETYEEATAAVRAHHVQRPASAQRCHVGELLIVQTEGHEPAEPAPGLLWIMGFNGGESDRAKDEDGNTPSANRWFSLCEQAAKAVDSPSWIICERVHWGSPSVGALIERVASPNAFSDLLRFHAEVNRSLMALYRPRVVWMTGLSTCMLEAVEDYRLRRVGGPERGTNGHRLLQVYRDDADVPWLASRHPTGARVSGEDSGRVRAKLAELASAHRTE